MDAIEEDGLAVGEVVQDVANRPLPRCVGAREVALFEREALQRLVTGPFKLSNESRGCRRLPSSQAESRRRASTPDRVSSGTRLAVRPGRA